MKLHESLAFGVGLMNRLFEHELRAALRPVGVQPGQVPVLLALYETDGLTQSDLARIAGVEQPTMAATLRRMERDGLVRRSPDLDDQRRVGVYLSSTARALEQPVIDAARAVNRRAVRGLSADERSLLYRVIDRAHVNLGAS